MHGGSIPLCLRGSVSGLGSQLLFTRSDQSPLWVCAVTRRRFPMGVSPHPANAQTLKRSSRRQPEQPPPGRAYRGRERPRGRGSWRNGALGRLRVAPRRPALVLAPALCFPLGLGSSMIPGVRPGRMTCDAVVGQNLASLARDQLAALRAALKMEIPRHGIRIRPPA